MHSHVLYSILYDSMYSPLVSPRASWSTMRLWRRVLITCLMHSWDSSLERILARLLWRPEHKLIYGVLGWVLLTILHNSWDIYFLLSLYCCIEHVVGLKHVNCSLLVLQISPFSDCIRKDRFSLLFRTASDGKLGGAWKQGYPSLGFTHMYS